MSKAEKPLTDEEWEALRDEVRGLEERVEAAAAQRGKLEERLAVRMEQLAEFEVADEKAALALELQLEKLSASLLNEIKTGMMALQAEYEW